MSKSRPFKHDYCRRIKWFVLLLLLMLTITAQLTFAEMGTIRGRIVSQASSYGSDMGAVIQILNNITYGQEISIECEDINCDGKVDMGDVILLLNNITYGYPVKCC